MPHTEYLIATQRIGCVNRYFDDSVRPWKVFLSHYLKNVGSEFLLKCNFKLSSLPCKLPIFYKECLEAWSDFKSCTPVTRQDILNEIIWNNQILLINKQSMFNKKIKEAGEWKLLLKNGDDVNQTDKTVSDDDVKDIACLSSKSIYSALVKRVQIPPTAQSKFDSLYCISNVLDWKNIYQLPGRVTLDTRTRAFQYKILNRILYTNSVSYKMKLIPSPLCPF